MGHSGAHHPIRREWAKKIVVDSCILCPNQEKKELCYLFCQNHRKHLPRHRAIPLSIRIRHPHLTTKLQSGPVMSDPGNARELESSEKVLQMWGTLIPYKPFHFVQHKDMPQNCLSSAEWLSCLDLQSPEGKTNTMTTTVTPAEHKAWFSTMDRERETEKGAKFHLLGSDFSHGSWRLKSPQMGRGVGGEWRGMVWRVAHQWFQMGFAEIHHMLLNELCSKLHCTEVNLDVNIV